MNDARPVIYTAVLGGRDRLRSPTVDGCPPSPAVRWVRFTDQDVPAGHQGWENVVVAPLAEAGARARWHKLLPHVLFPAAPWSCWMDGTHQWRQDPAPVAEAALEQADIATFGHVATALGEWQTLAQRFPAQTSLWAAQQQAYTAAGFDPNTRLRITTVVFRRHTPAMAAFNEAWYKEVEAWGWRDQIPLTYGLRMHERVCGELPGLAFFHPWFRYTAHTNDRGTCYPEYWGPFDRVTRKRFKQVLPHHMQMNALEKRLEAYLAAWHGRGEPHQWQMYRCHGCRRLVSWHQIRRGGCDCGMSNKLSPTNVRWWELAQLLLTPWRWR